MHLRSLPSIRGRQQSNALSVASSNNVSSITECMCTRVWELNVPDCVVAHWQLAPSFLLSHKNFLCNRDAVCRLQQPACPQAPCRTTSKPDHPYFPPTDGAVLLCPDASQNNYNPPTQATSSLLHLLLHACFAFRSGACCRTVVYVQTLCV